jgi:glycosyltransferase involved in cell wall biosynthesis
MTARVSIILPMYNAAPYVRETVESVLAQTYADWDLTVVDDGSTDRSRTIVEGLSDARIRVVVQPNSGVSAARNRGLALTAGEYVGFLDSDDVWLPTNLEEKVAWLDAHPQHALVNSDVEVIDAYSRLSGVRKTGREGWVLDDLLLWNGDSLPGLPSNALIRRSVLETVGAFDSTLSTAADQDLKFRIAARYPVGRLERPPIRYRVHGANMHLDISVMERDHLHTYRKATRLGLFRSAAFRRRCYSNLYFILAGSWWHGGNRKRAAWFLVRSVGVRPASTLRIARKALRLLRSRLSHA